MAQIRGSALRGTLRFVKRTGLEGGIAAAMTSIHPGLAAWFERPIDADAWYPYRAYCDLLEHVDGRLGHGDQGMRSLGRFAARQDLSGVFDLVSVTSSVGQILQSASSFWDRYHDTGRFTIESIGEGTGIARIVDFPELDPVHCRQLLGWIEGMGLAAGGTTVEVDLTAAPPRFPHAEFSMRWT